VKPRAPDPASGRHELGITDDDVDFILALEKKRAAYMDHLKAALEAGNQAEVDYWGRLVCGLEPEGKLRTQ
jgi:hypothetical protein